MATVFLAPSAALELEALNNPIHGRVLKLLARLEEWPAVSGAKLRTGDYRVQFIVIGDHVTVEKIGHRDGFYDE